jgi:hypothetical protein
LNGMNPYVGLQDFVSWEACGIGKGKLEEIKNSKGVKEMVYTPSDSPQARWAVRHLGKTITSSQLFTAEVFTEEVLKELDENVIKKHFILPSMGSAEELTAALLEDGDQEDGQE